MGTKNNPGKFDCYASAEPDEPMFVLLARDPSAPWLTVAWAALRNGDLQGAMDHMKDAFEALQTAGKTTTPNEKLSEAIGCGFKMLKWREANRP